MSNKIDDGGQAFPIAYPESHSIKVSGMSLRDWFAGQALAGMIEKFDAPLHEDDALYYLAKRAFSQADAMLAAREEGAK
jgi:hypothetical protein